MFVPRSSFFALLSLALPAAVSAAAIKKRANCDCGYVDDQGRVWRESVESDFTSSAGALSVVSDNWLVQDWTAPPSETAPLARQNVVENVLSYQDALGLRTSAYDGSGTTKISEIDSKRGDVLYGTFRMRAQIPSVPGVCFGFFSYNGATSPVSEIDIEFLTSEADYYQRVHYTNQPGNVNGEADPDAHHSDSVPGADFTTFGEHRFDWVPGQTEFYYNGQRTDALQKNVPSVPSNIIANVWSNGDPGWSQGPPSADATATVQFIKMYFNSTSFDEGAFNARCAAAGSVDKCSI
ncbi:concanavalin A-like lectin/glucanase domain-containing protein [Auriculariales sp. MPI-PUGE-AT-0066]|nr:concanavalin A-like lectin/glucanase domain-containing protein [Auriculariales sp. MPI-PUGE-AT-0066]